jgi:hypothetical protein
MMIKRMVAVTAVGAAAFGLTGCAGYRTERQGRDVGRAICDIKTAGNANDAQRALDKLNRNLASAQRITGRPVSEDVRDIQNNLNDLVQHVSNGQSALAHQDVVVIQRNVQTVSNQGPTLVRRFYQGVSEGLNDCI